MVYLKRLNHGEERRFTDNKSELDIALKENTSDVAMDEILDTSNEIKKELEQNNLINVQEGDSKKQRRQEIPNDKNKNR